MSISSFSLDFIDTIVNIEQQSLYSNWSKEMFVDEFKNKFSFFKIIKNNNIIIGFIIYRIIFDEAEILNIVIDKQYRGLKFGKHLFNFVIEDIKQKGCKTIFLEVCQNNFIAQSLYISFGFKQYLIREKYYKNFDAILMKLCL